MGLRMLVLLFLVYLAVQLTATQQATLTRMFTSDPDCGGDLSGNTGFLKSPNYPDNYPHDSSCLWLITAPASRTVHLAVLDFSFESSRSCDLDYLALYDGSALIAKFCGRDMPSPASYETTSNQMYVRMVTDGSVSGRGFKAVFLISSSSLSTQGCGGEFSGEIGFLTSLNYPDHYPYDDECGWLITVPTSHTVNLTFVDFELEDSEDCSYDAVALHDGRTAASPLIATLCGRSQPDPASYMSTSNHMYVHMSADEDINGRGFMAIYEQKRSAVPNQGCGGQLSGESGLLASPGYPSNYPDDADCRWLITVEDSHFINFTFVDFEMESSDSCAYDSVSLHDGEDAGSPRILKHCGQQLPAPASYISSSNQLYVRLATDENTTGRGFMAIYEQKSARNPNERCGGQLSGESGLVMSPNYPDNYPHERECGWLITVEDSQLINITFMDFRIEGSPPTCFHDHVALYDGSSATSSRIVKHCGHQVPTPTSYVSTSNQLYVHMSTDHDITGRGFMAVYRRKQSDVANQGCGGQLSGESGQLMSPGYPQNYPHGLDCGWLITAPTSKTIKLIFVDFDVEDSTECVYDYVAVYDGPDTSSRLIVKHCGDELPTPSVYKSTSDQLYLQMSTDGSSSGSGFKAKYSIGSDCGRRRQPGQSSRIVGGHLADRVDAPWQVSLHKMLSTGSLAFFCGGTVLSESWVLSAAHCLYDKYINTVHVIVGHTRLNSFDQGMQMFEVDEIKVHDRYNRITHDYDIALVKVKPIGGHAIRFNENVEPACLPSPSYFYESDRSCFISGWGRTRYRNTNYLREASVSLFDRHACNSRSSYDGRLTPRMVCAGNMSGGVDTCQGDSGGPLVCDENGRYAIYGVTSWGYGCGRRGKPGVYTKVKYFLDWIKRETGI